MKILVLLLSIYLLLNGIYFVITFLASLFYKQAPGNNKIDYSYLFVVPAYKEDAVILTTLKSIKNQNYASGKFDILLLADSLQPATLDKVRAMNVPFLHLHFQESTKLKSLKKVIEHQVLSQDFVVLLDADNTIAPDFLTSLNSSVSFSTHKATQLQRAAKNSDAPLSYLDAFSEFANEHLLCKGPSVLGLSSKLSGSGMVFETETFVQVIPSIDAISGFDKALEIALTDKNIKIKYLENPCIYDEKVEEVQQLSRQRGRWIYAQYDFFRKNFAAGIKSLFNREWDHGHKVLQLGLLPRMIGFFVVVLLQVAVLLQQYPADFLFVTVIAQLLFLLPYIGLFLVFVSKYGIHKGLINGIMMLFWGYLKAFTQIGKAKGKFLHTGHKVNN